MFLKLFSIEWTCLSRRILVWFMFLACIGFIGLSLDNFYRLNRAELLDGSLKMPGVSFDLANSLDQLLTAALPFLIVLAAIMLGSDYSQRTNQHWLMRASRSSSLLAKFSLLALLTFVLQVLALLAGAAVGWYFKTYIYHTFSLTNVNWPAVLAAAGYMTLVTLPYLALILLITIITRSTSAGIAIGLGYTLLVELLLASFFYGKEWIKWLPSSLHLSATYFLNSIGNRAIEIPPFLLPPIPAFVAAAIYTLILLAAALWLYQHQDIGG